MPYFLKLQYSYVTASSLNKRLISPEIINGFFSFYTSKFIKSARTGHFWVGLSRTPLSIVFARFLSESRIRLLSITFYIFYSCTVFIGAFLSIFLLLVSPTGPTYYYHYRFVITRGETADIEGHRIILS